MATHIVKFKSKLKPKPKPKSKPKHHAETKMQPLADHNCLSTDFQNGISSKTNISNVSSKTNSSKVNSSKVNSSKANSSKANSSKTSSSKTSSSKANSSSKTNAKIIRNKLTTHSKPPAKADLMQQQNIKSQLCYVKLGNTKIYSSVTPEDIKQMIVTSKYISSITDPSINDIITPIEPTISVIVSQLKSVSFNEEKDEAKFPIPSNNINMVSCNYWAKQSPTYVEPKAKVKSNRGRKPRAKKPKTRRTPGNGKHFASCVCISIKKPARFINKGTNPNCVTFKPKLYRNGRVGISDIKHPKYEDVLYIMNEITQYLQPVFQDIEFTNNLLVLQNFKCILQNNMDNEQKSTLLIDVGKFKDVAVIEKQLFGGPRNMYRRHVINKVLLKCLRKHDTRTHYSSHATGHDTDYDTEYDNILSIIHSYVGGFNEIKEISYDAERNPALTIKFSRPIITDIKSKKVTVKLLSSGKINFDGCNDIHEAQELYAWVKYIITTYPSVILDTSQELVNSDDDVCSQQSIYDFMTREEVTAEDSKLLDKIRNDSDDDEFDNDESGNILDDNALDDALDDAYNTISANNEPANQAEWPTGCFVTSI